MDDIVNLTSCAWIYPETVTAADFDNIMRKSSSTNGWEFFIDNSTGPGIRLEFLRYFSTTDGDWLATSNTAPLNTWTHACVTYNNSSAANDPVFYINGVVAPTITELTTPVGTAMTDVAENFAISYSTSTRFFDGTIDEVRLYSRILTAAEIKALYAQGR